MVTLDTNIFVYAIDQAEPEKSVVASDIASRLQRAGAPIALQVCGEFFVAASRRSGRAPWEVAQSARNLLAAYPSFRTSRAAVERALAEAAAGRFSYWDALLLASADEAGCTAILTEDMADGARLSGVEVIHPFAGGSLSERAQAALNKMESA